MDISIAQLRYIVALDAHRHFGRAAAYCCVSQPTLSMQLQKLEAALGVELFDRTRKPVEPTDIGALVVAQARTALAAFERIPALVADEDGRVAGELRLGIIPTLAPYLLPLVTDAFLARYPAITLDVKELQTAALLDALDAESLDAGLIATEEARPGFSSEALFTEPFVAYVAEAHPLARAARVDPASVAAQDLWLLREGHCFRDQVLNLCGAGGGGEQALRFEGSNLETLRILVEQRGGLTLLPLLATRFLAPVQQARLRPLAEPVPGRTVRLVAGRGYLKRAALRAYAGVVREEMASQPGVRVE